MWLFKFDPTLTSIYAHFYATTYFPVSSDITGLLVDQMGRKSLLDRFITQYPIANKLNFTELLAMNYN